MANSWQWMEPFKAVLGTATFLKYGIYVAAGKTAYVCVPTLRNTSIGETGYAPVIPELIWLEHYVELATAYALGAGGATATLTFANKLPPGIKTVHGVMQATNVAAGQYIDIIDNISFYNQLGGVWSQAANVPVSCRFSGPQVNDAIQLYAGGNTGWTINYLRITGIEI